MLWYRGGLVLIDSCITQLKAQGPSRTCNESKEEEEVCRPVSASASHRPGGRCRAPWEFESPFPGSLASSAVFGIRSLLRLGSSPMQRRKRCRSGTRKCAILPGAIPAAQGLRRARPSCSCGVIRLNEYGNPGPCLGWHGLTPTILSIKSKSTWARSVRRWRLSGVQGAGIRRGS